MPAETPSDEPEFRAKDEKKDHIGNFFLVSDSPQCRKKALTKSTTPKNMTKTNIISMLCATGLMAVSSAASSSVVYGNLGANEAGAISNTNTILTTDVLRSQGFTTGGNSTLELQTIKLGLSADTATNVTVSVYANNTNKPGALLFTSSAVSVSSQALYSFSFTGVNLQEFTDYWVSPSSDVRWHISGDESSPDELNSSGYAFNGTKQSTNGGSSWSNSILPYSVSISAVPEPSSALLGALGMLALVRRRR
jgi:MYXO-CTERM domain-containing protein